MKLLGWMHRKSRQNNNESTKNFTIGNCSACFSGKVSFDEQKYHVEPTDTFSASWQPKEVGAVFQEESSEPFAFLAIGTFGSELMDTDPPTPTFPMPSEKTTNEQTETRENDLDFINFELEKFLEVEAEVIGNYSSQRSSLANIITICDEGVEGADSEAYTNMVAFPLQNSLFGSSIHQLARIRAQPDIEKASFDELFKKNKIVDDDSNGEHEGPKKRANGNCITHFMKKMMKKLHSTSKRSNVSSSGDATESSSVMRKLPKGIKVFHRKVHPEGLITEKRFKLQKGMAKNIALEHEGGHWIEKDNGKKKPSQTANIKQYEQNVMNRSSNCIGKGASTVNREHWIRTDADYLVLEL